MAVRRPAGCWAAAAASVEAKAVRAVEPAMVRVDVVGTVVTEAARAASAEALVETVKAAAETEVRVAVGKASAVAVLPSTDAAMQPICPR